MKISTYSKWARRNSHYIVNASVIFCIIAILISLSSKQSKSRLYEKEAPTVKVGKVDISGWDFETKGQIKINDEWEFYYLQLLSSKDIKDGKNLPPIYVKADERWKNISVDGKPLPSYGYGTYRLTIQHDKDISPLALSVYSFLTSSKVYINGKLCSQTGKVGTSPENSEPCYHPKVVQIEAEGNTTEVIIQVSNFYATNGGGNRPVYIGLAKDLLKKDSQRNIATGLSSGALGVMGIFFLILFLFWNNDKSFLHFSLFCLSFSSFLLTSFYFPIITLFPNLPFERVRYQEYSALYVLTYSCFAFYTTTFPDKFSFIVKRVLKYITFGCIGMLILTPHSVFSIITKYHHGLTGLIFIYLLVKSIIVTTQNKPYSGFMLTGGVILFTCGIYQIGTYFKWFNSIPMLFEIMPIVYMLSQAFILAHKIARAFRREERSRFEIEEQAMEVATQAEELSMTNDMLQTQKVQLEKINEKTAANINAASNIQRAILPQIEDLQQYVDGAFVIWKPKDIVGGDIYWFRKINNKIIIAAVDCTGHGVSGALMSMSASHLLQEITVEMDILSPEKILEQMNKKLLKRFSQNTANKQASMDAAVTIIDEDTQQLLYAGARSPLVYVQDGTLHHIKGDRASLGNKLKEGVTFTLHRIDLNTPTAFYMFSDGYQDQFGGDEDRKFGIKRMKEFLANSNNLPMEKQHQNMENALDQWKGDTKQIDDIMLLGVNFIPERVNKKLETTIKDGAVLTE